MGHYDDQREASDREAAARASAAAESEAKRLKLPVLLDPTWHPIGVCRRCAQTVMAVPNWGCTNSHCPHKP